MEEKVLVIDDEKEFVLLLETVLTKEGYSVVKAYDGEEGLLLAAKEKPDLIICDINMPKKDGYWVLKGVRQGSGKCTPFIMLSAIDEYKKIEEAYEFDADFYISKPAEIEILVRSVRVLLDVSKNRKTAEGGQDGKTQGQS